MVRDRLLAALVTVVATTLPSPVLAQGTVAADRFVDAAGINIHLHYDEALYKRDFPLVKSRLIELGIRHVRDGLVDTTWRGYYDRHNELGEAGIKGTYITAPGQTMELWVDYPRRVSKSFEAYEAPNEYDKSRKPDWAQTLADTVRRLSGVRNVPEVAHFPIYGPSLTSSSAYAALGDVSAYYDFTNLHNYFAGRHPETRGWGANGYGSISWNLGLSGEYAAGKPTVTTETGYQDIASAEDPVPQEIAARYMPRILLEQFRAGIVRTFLYELCDFPRSGGYGLLNDDGSPKPSFAAVKNLLTLLADPGEPFTPQELTYSLLGGSAETRHLAFQKRDGTYYVALWLAVPGWNARERRMIETRTENVTVSFIKPMRVIRTHRWQADGSVSVDAASTTTTNVPVTVADRLLIVEAVHPDNGTLMR